MLWPPGAGRPPAARELGPEPFDPAFDATTCGGAARAHCGDQARADGQRRRGRRGQHLRERGAVPRRHPAVDAGAAGVAGAARAAGGRRARCSPTPSPRAAAPCATTSTPAASRATSSCTTSSTAARASLAAPAGRRSAMRRLGGRASFYCPLASASSRTAAPEATSVRHAALPVRATAASVAARRDRRAVYRGGRVVL